MSKDAILVVISLAVALVYGILSAKISALREDLGKRIERLESTFFNSSSKD